MFLVNPKGMTFHPKIIDLTYKLIFHSLRTLNFSDISYFALVFSCQMLVLEYQNEYDMLKIMISSFLYQFLPLFLIKTFDLTFENLFELHPISCNNLENNKFHYCIRKDLDIVKIINFLNLKICNLLNQITFCRTFILQELMRLKVVDKIHETNPPSKDELKIRFFKIQELSETNIYKMLLLLIENNESNVNFNLQSYNKENCFNETLIGKILFFIFEKII